MENFETRAVHLPLASVIELLRARLRFFTRVRKSDGELVSGVVRLSETSPHLLSDIGFEAVAGPSGPEWSNGAIRVEVPRSDAATRLMRVGRF
jgi:hypothetical protein